MKIYEYDPTRDEEFNKFNKIITKESERGAAIISNAYIEDLLKEIMKIRLIHNGENKIIEIIENLPVQQLIFLCYATGILTIEEKNELNIINEIRNKFAHKRKIASFRNKIISDKCSKLRLPRFSRKFTAREKFDLLVSYYLQILNLKLLQTKKIERVEQESRSIGMLTTLKVPKGIFTRPKKLP
jgi:hypothetical protein